MNLKDDIKGTWKTINEILVKTKENINFQLFSWKMAHQ